MARCHVELRAVAAVQVGCVRDTSSSFDRVNVNDLTEHGCNHQKSLMKSQQLRMARPHQHRWRTFVSCLCAI